MYVCLSVCLSVRMQGNSKSALCISATVLVGLHVDPLRYSEIAHHSVFIAFLESNVRL